MAGHLSDIGTALPPSIESTFTHSTFTHGTMVPSQTTPALTTSTSSQSETSIYSAPSITITPSLVDAPSLPSNGGVIIGGVILGILGLLAITSLIVIFMRKHHINQKAHNSNLRAFCAGVSAPYHDRSDPSMGERPQYDRSQTEPPPYNPVPFSKTGPPPSSTSTSSPYSFQTTDVQSPISSLASSRHSPVELVSPPPKFRHHNIAPLQFSEYPSQPVSPGKKLHEFPKPPPLSLTPTSMYLRRPSSLMSYNVNSPSAASCTSGTHEYGYAI